jgi:hypothetical protein
VLVFGRRRITNDAEHSGPAYENRQRTKPREKVRTAVPRSAYQRAPEAGFLYNLSVTARRLLEAQNAHGAAHPYMIHANAITPVPIKSYPRRVV